MIYTRANPDPNPLETVYNPENIIRKDREKEPDLLYYLERSLYFPKDGAQSIDDIEFDAFFEQTLF
jgi:hypothetical protein